jgi:hypothetical protein
MAGRRQSGRRRRKPRVDAHGKYYGMGPQFEDADSGWLFPKRKYALAQRGRLVSRRWRDGSRDRPKSY